MYKDCSFKIIEFLLAFGADYFRHMLFIKVQDLKKCLPFSYVFCL